MEAINVIKGYNKVNTHHQNPSPPPPHKRLKAAVIISAVVLLTLTVGLMIAAVNIHESKESPTSLSSSNSNEFIKTVCKVTRYPDLCFTSISSSLNVSTTKNFDPEFIFKLSLQVSINEFSNVSSSIKNLYDHFHSAQAALVDCMGQLEDALSRLNDSLSATKIGSGGGEKVLTARKVNDIQTWISAAMTDEDSCLDGLLEMESTVADEVKIKTEKSRKLLSNSLAIIANMQPLLHKFGLTMH